MQNNPDFRSRLPMPKTAYKSGIARPMQSAAGGSRLPVSSYATSTCIKPTLKTMSTNLMTQTSLRVRPHPYMSATNARPITNTALTGLLASVSPQVVTRLDFDVENRREQTPQDINKRFANVFPKAVSKTTSPAVDWQSMTKESEVIALKTQITKLETLLDENKHKMSEKSVEYEAKIERLAKESQRHEHKCVEFDNQMKVIELRADEANGQLSNAREEFSREYEKYEKTINQLNKTVVELRNQLSDNQVAIESVEANHRSQMLSVEHQMQSMQSQVIELSEEKQLLEQHIQRLQSDVKDRDQIEAELKNAKVNICLLDEELKSYKDGIKLSDILDNELQELRQLREQNVELQRTNESLSDVHSKNQILEEKLIEFEVQLNERNNRLKQVMETDLEVNELRKRLADWQQMLANESPVDVCNQLSSVQNNAIVLRTELASLQTQCNEMSSNKQQLESDLKTTQTQLHQQNEYIKKLNRKCILFAKEKESYKQLISSYEHDVTLDWNKVSKDRISCLETIVDDYRVLVEQLETEIKGLKNTDEAEECRQKIKELENSFSKTKQMKDTPPVEVVESMDTSPALLLSPPETTPTPVYRVIHFNQNPIAVTIEDQNKEFKRLVEENQRLMSKIEILESNTASEADVTRRLEDGIKNSQELEKLQKKLQMAEKSQQKIIEAFKRTSKDFREVCYRLTGFRIDLLKQNTYRLAHMYADSPDDVLLFECDADRTVKMLENQYSNKLQESVQTYLTAHDSFPAFLASLTLELFHKQTIVS